MKVKEWIVGLLVVAAAAGCSPKSETYVPEPETVSTGDLRVGAFRCPLWYEKTRPGCWDALKDYPERTPVLGYYNEAYPEVVDWEIKYALEHGISFFFECWFRAKDNAGKAPVEATLDNWLHEGFFQSRYGDRMQFAILWENTNGVASSITSEDDLVENLVPYWIEHFFSRDNYLRVDGKPLLMIYGYPRLVEDLGSVEAATAAIARMRAACEAAGLGGLYLLAEHHYGLDEDISFLTGMGFDAVTSYHWPSFSGLMPQVPEDTEEIVDLQEACWTMLSEASRMPSIPTLSMGWDSRPWNRSYYTGEWYLTPQQFEDLASRAANHVERQPESPVSGMILLDNWNEFGEGHYIFPTEQFGFGYLDAVRNAFSSAPRHHTDLVPEAIGLGPYTYEATKDKK